MRSTESNLAVAPVTRAFALSTALRWCALALLTTVVALGFVKPLLTLGRFIPLDTNEGWNAYFGEIAIEGGQLYPSAGSMITNNYPPLSFYLVGGVGHLTGDNIFAGRVIALLSLLFVAWGINSWLRLTGSSRKIGFLGSAVFLAYAVTYGRDYVAMNDPQWLAHAAMMSGLLLLWRAKDDTRHIVAGCVLMMAGGWIKHLLLPLPLAVTAWLLWRSRISFAKWAVCSALVLASAAALVWWLYGGNFFDSLLAPRQYLRAQMIARSMGAVKVLGPMLFLWVVAVARDRLDERVGFVSLYLVIAGIVGIGASGGAGVDVNAFFDVMIAASLASALGVESLGRRTGSVQIDSLRWHPAQAAAALLLAVCLAGYAASLGPDQIEQIRDVKANEQAALEDIHLISARGQGKAACQLPSLCYWAKARFTVDFFYLGQKLKKGVIPAGACATVFGGKEIPLLELDPNVNFRKNLLPEYCTETILANYRVFRESTFGPLMVPNTEAAWK